MPTSVTTLVESLALSSMIFTMALMSVALSSVAVPMMALYLGGCGLAAVCDIVVADDAAVFGFTETKLGILPAMISPYVLQKIGASAARELFLTGMRFDAARAKEIGLVHAVVPLENLDTTIDRYVSEALSAAPTAVARAKALIPRVLARPTTEVMAITTEAIAAQRVSAEGQDGLKAFLARGKPGWVPE